MKQQFPYLLKQELFRESILTSDIGQFLNYTTKRIQTNTNNN